MKVYQFSYKLNQYGKVYGAMMNLEASSLEAAKKSCLKSLSEFYRKEYVKGTMKFERTVGLSFW